MYINLSCTSASLYRDHKKERENSAVNSSVNARPYAIRDSWCTFVGTCTITRFVLGSNLMNAWTMCGCLDKNALKFEIMCHDVDTGGVYFSRIRLSPIASARSEKSLSAVMRVSLFAKTMPAISTSASFFNLPLLFSSR